MSCTGGPSPAPWRSQGNELATVYFKSGSSLMEITCRANGAKSVVNLSNHISGLGPINRDPTVSFFDVPTNRISLLTSRVGETSVLVSVDYYDGSWHTSEVFLLFHDGYIKPYFSKHATRRHFIHGTWMDGPSNYQVFYKTSDTRGWAARTKFIDAPADVNFGGYDTVACREACLVSMTDSPSNMGRWNSDFTVRDMDDWQSFITLTSVHNTPRTRHGGDPSFGFAQSSYDPKAVYRVGYFGGGSVKIAVPGVPYTVPLPVSNVYEGSIYERDAYFSIETPPGSGAFRLHRIYEKSGLDFVEDMGRDVTHSN